MEAKVDQGLRELFALWSEPQGLTRQANAELRRLWSESGHSDNASARCEIEKIEGKIVNIRRPVENGLADASWDNRRLREFLAKQGALSSSLDGGESPQVASKTAMAYCR